MNLGIHTKMVVEAGLMIVLSYILHFIVLFQFPQGGAITAASTAPLVLYALRWGVKPGMVVSTVYGIIVFFAGMTYTLPPVSIVLEYIVGYGILGVAGAFGQYRGQAMTGTTLACLLRCLVATVSSMIVFQSAVPAGQDLWTYSLVYNASYLLPEMILTLMAVFIFYPKIKEMKTLK